VRKAVIQLENGQTFTIDTKNQKDKNVYVQQVLLNGKPLEQPVLHHSAITGGGTLLFVMGPKPMKKLFAGK
jgi:putative alpha-1,2-mannosidase